MTVLCHRRSTFFPSCQGKSNAGGVCCALGHHMLSLEWAWVHARPQVCKKNLGQEIWSANWLVHRVLAFSLLELMSWIVFFQLVTVLVCTVITAVTFKYCPYSLGSSSPSANSRIKPKKRKTTLKKKPQQVTLTNNQLEAPFPSRSKH